MNYESIANGEKRIFPYYKGKFLGVTDLGYANKKSAQKFMTQIPDADYDTDISWKIIENSTEKNSK